MADGRVLSIGVNQVHSAAYRRRKKILTGAANDATSMHGLARSLGYQSLGLLIDREATMAEVLGRIASAARATAAGDTFLLTFAGHGSQFPELPWNDDGKDESDGSDETWCLFDGELLDDSVRTALNAFPSGSRIVVVLDCCHSGTAATAPIWAAADKDDVRLSGRDTSGRHRSLRPASTGISAAYLRAMRQIAPFGTMHAEGIVFAACRDNQLAEDGDPNGVFTRALLQVWNDGSFTGSYEELRTQIEHLVPSSQTPQLTAMTSGASQLGSWPAFRL